MAIGIEIFENKLLPDGTNEGKKICLAAERVAKETKTKAVVLKPGESYSL